MTHSLRAIGMASRRVTGLSQADVEALATQQGNVVMRPTYDVVFEPWPRERVRRAVDATSRLARGAVSADAAQAKAMEDPELAEFASKYQVMFKRASDPAVAGNESHMATIHHMIDVFDQMQRGAVSEQDARASVSDRALSGLLAQMPPPHVPSDP